jgi:radical SAM protein with 4Fe4S-binding SPASM domain
MDIDVFDKVLFDLKEMNKRRDFIISLNQFGEETLHPEYLDILKLVENNKLRLLTSSNSTKFDVNIGKKFIDLGKQNLIYRLQLSLYGIDEVSYIQQTGVNLFNKSLDNIRNFIKLYEETQSSFDVCIQIVISKVNSSLISRNKFIELFDIVNDKIKIRFVRAHDWLGAVTAGNKPHFPLYCNKIFSEMVVFANGDVSYCCFNCFHDPVLGNVKTNTLKEIWCNDLSIKYRNDWKLGKKRNVPLCDNCHRIGPYPKKDIEKGIELSIN